MDVPDPSAWTRLHLIGIGGAGMCGIGRLLIARGIRVTGSDVKASPGLAALQALGATVWVGHHRDQLDRPDAVVVSSAIPPENPELRAAVDRGVPVLMRAQVLAALMRGRRSVAIAGTHGKTTTTSMIAVILTRAGLDPTYVIGGELNESGSGAAHGAGEVFVAEADESDGSFLLLEPEVAVVTNVEEDHLDFYGGRDQVEAAFAEFGRRSRTVVACWDDEGVRRCLSGSGTRLVRYAAGVGEPRGLASVGDESGVDAVADIRLADITLHAFGSTATVVLGDRDVLVRLAVPGQHNVLNAAAALAVADLLGVDLEMAAEALGHFTGTRRRFERRGSARGATFVDDYAHHPTEVAVTISAARNLQRTTDGASPPRRIVAVFQPHRYTRTQALWRPLGESLREADVVVVTDVYGAGEEPIPGVSGKLVAEALAEAAPGKRVVYLPRRHEIAPFLAGELRDGDLVLTLGAGDITMAAGETLDLLRGEA